MTPRASTMADVAARAGVSKKTVSSVINGVGQVRAETRERVRTAIADLGYEPNPVARRLSAGRTGSVTLAVPHLGSGDLAMLASTVIAEAERQGLGVLCEPAGEGPVRPTHGVSDGLLLVPGRPVAGPGGDGPVVVLGHRRVEAAVDQVVAPAGDALRQLVAHLDVGDDLLVLAGRDEIDLVPDDLAPFLVTAADASAGAGLAALAADERRARGVVTLGTGLGIGAAHALRSAGLRIPRDVRLAAVGAGPEPAFTVPGITTAAPDLDQLVATAMRALTRRIGGDSGPARVVEVPSVVTVRASTGG